MSEVGYVPAHSLRRRITAFVALLRLHWTRWWLVSMFASALLAQGLDISPRNAVLLFFATIFGHWGTAFMDDLMDVNVDRFIRPQRPLPAGEFSRGPAAFFMVLFFAIAVVLTGLIGIPSVIVGSAIAALYVVAHALRRRLPNSPLIGVCGASTYLIPYISLGGFDAAIGTLMATMFFWDLGHDILCDTREVEGDRIGQQQMTIPTVVGVVNSVRIVGSSATLAVVLSVVLTFTGSLGPIYLVVALTGAVLFLRAVGVLWRRPSPATAEGVRPRYEGFRWFVLVGIVIDRIVMGLL